MNPFKSPSIVIYICSISQNSADRILLSDSLEKLNTGGMCHPLQLSNHQKSYTTKKPQMN